VSRDFFLSVATFFKNNSDVLEQYVEDTVKVLNGNYENYEILLVDNGSTDGTTKLAKELLCKYKNIRLLVLAKEYSEQIVYTAALENCIGDFTVIMDINSDPPQLIPEMTDLAYTGKDVVIARRENAGNHSPLYRFFAFMFYTLSNLLAGYKIDTNWSNYVCFSRKIINCILQVKDKNRYLKYLSIEYGFARGYVKYKTINRSNKRKKVDLIRKIDSAISMFVSNTNKPIKIAAFMGYIACFLNIAYIVYVIAVNFLKPDVAEGWTSSSIVLASMFAILFFIISIICNYIACIMDEVKTGPLFSIAEECNSCVLFENLNKNNVV